MNFKNLAVNVLSYFYGLILTFVTLFVLTAMKYVKVVEATKQEELLAQAITAFAVWTIFYVIIEAISSLGNFEIGCIWFLLLCAGIGYLAMSIATYVNGFFHYGVLVYDTSDDAKIVVGILLALISAMSGRLAKNSLTNSGKKAAPTENDDDNDESE